MTRFTTMVLLAVLSVVGLADAGRASFTVTITGGPFSPTGYAANNGASTGTINNGNATVTSNPTLPGGVTFTYSSTAVQDPSTTQLSTNFTFNNFSANAYTNIVFTISQNAFDFPDVTSASNAISISTVGINTATASSNANLGFIAFPTYGPVTPATNGPASSTNQTVTFSVASIPAGPPNPNTITQQFTINSIAAGTSITFQNLTLLSIPPSPAPATILAAVGGLPLLGLAGLLRRRFLGA